MWAPDRGQTKDRLQPDPRDAPRQVPLRQDPVKQFLFDARHDISVQQDNNGLKGRDGLQAAPFAARPHFPELQNPE